MMMGGHEAAPTHDSRGDPWLNLEGPPSLSRIVHGERLNPRRVQGKLA